MNIVMAKVGPMIVSTSIARLLKGWALVLLAAATVFVPAVLAQDLRLSVAQQMVYKLGDSNKLDSESWMFYVIVDGSEKADDVKLSEGKIELLSGEVVLQTTILSSDVLSKMRRTSFLISEKVPDSSIRRRYGRSELFDLRFDVLNIPTQWKTDAIRLTIRSKVRDKPETSLTLNVPIHVYEQKTPLLSPIKGPAIVSQGSFNNGGHSGFGNQFAIDILGLDPNYAPMVRDGEANSDYAGWGREVLATAAKLFMPVTMFQTIRPTSIPN